MFGSACQVAYNYHTQNSLWEPLARLVLEASYEAVLWVSLQSSIFYKGRDGSKKVYLTLLGKDVIGNPEQWVVESLKESLMQFCACDLEVHIVSLARVPCALLPIATRAVSSV